MILQGKIAIVTGAGQGGGQGIANVLAREGAKVTIADLNLDRAKVAAGLIKSRNGEAMAYRVDVMKMSEVNAMVEATLRAYGGLHILVNNAVAPSINVPFAQSKEEDWDQDLGVGLKGYLICTRAVINHFLQQNYGRIISISSSAGKMGSPNLAAYSAAKGAIIGFTKALARELARLLHGLLCHVNLIQLNPVAESPYQPSSPARAAAFLAVLEKAGIPATMRTRRGLDIDAGCGQLRRRVARETRR